MNKYFALGLLNVACIYVFINILVKMPVGHIRQITDTLKLIMIVKLCFKNNPMNYNPRMYKINISAHMFLNC